MSRRLSRSQPTGEQLHESRCRPILDRPERRQHAAGARLEKRARQPHPVVARVESPGHLRPVRFGTRSIRPVGRQRGVRTPRELPASPRRRRPASSMYEKSGLCLLSTPNCGQVEAHRVWSRRHESRPQRLSFLQGAPWRGPPNCARMPLDLLTGCRQPIWMGCQRQHTLVAPARARPLAKPHPHARRGGKGELEIARPESGRRASSVRGAPNGRKWRSPCGTITSARFAGEEAQTATTGSISTRCNRRNGARQTPPTADAVRVLDRWRGRNPPGRPTGGDRYSGRGPRRYRCVRNQHGGARVRHQVLEHDGVT